MRVGGHNITQYMSQHTVGMRVCCRLCKCKAELLKQVQEEGNTAALCSQLGAVCGSEADCHRQLSQPEKAKACYQESVQHLQACQSQDAEVRLDGCRKEKKVVCH